MALPSTDLLSALRPELSDPVHVPRTHFRDAAINFLDEIVDEPGLETSALAGGSMGGTWALWYALARPERLRRLVREPPTPSPTTKTPNSYTTSRDLTLKKRG